MDPFTIVGALAQFAPTIVGWIAGDDAEQKAQKVVDVAQNVTGTSDPNSAVSALKDSPELAFQFEREVMQMQIAIEKENTKRMVTINETMKAEAKSEKWPQYSWRPYNGFLFGTTLFMNYALPAMFNSLVAPWMTNPPTVEPGSIPEWVFIVWGGVLGVMAHHRGKQKREVAGGKRVPGILDKARSLINK